MNPDRLQLGRGFWIRWGVASATGLSVGFTAYFMLVVGLPSEQVFVLKTLASAVGGVILGAAVGGAQMFVLRSEFSRTNRWMVANLIGGIIGGILALPVAQVVGEAMGFKMAVFAGSIVLGLFLGIAQAVILRGSLSGGGWWVLSQAAGIPFGWVLGRGLGKSIYNLVAGGIGEDIARLVANVIVIVLFFGGYGMLTGGVLVRLLQHNERN
jgi:hypothetical protein